MPRVLFIASLHHPETLLREQAAAQQAGEVLPLFPSSMAQRFYEKALRKRGYEVEVFWRNLPGYGARDAAQLKSHKYTARLTPQRLLTAATQRLPYELNPDYRRRNALLLEQARRFQPDILWMIGDNRVIHAHTLQQLKQETGAKLLYAAGTSPIVFSHPIEREAARLIDLVLAVDYYHGIQWLELGAQDMIALPVTAIDPQFHAPRPLTEAQRQQYACEVGFVGTLIPDNLYSKRVQALEALRGFDLGIWSVHDVPASLKPSLRGAALGDDMLRVLSAATMSVNVHGDFVYYGGNMRLFELAAVGTFQLVHDLPGVHQWFTEGEHLAVFRSMDDLREKAAYYLAHPAERERIAAAARAHVLANHTYEQRLTALEQHLAEG